MVSNNNKLNNKVKKNYIGFYNYGFVIIHIGREKDIVR